MIFLYSQKRIGNFFNIYFYTRIEKNTTILSNRSKILQKRNKHSDYHIMIKILLHYNNSIVNGKNII
jgi:hypothetical protein